MEIASLEIQLNDLLPRNRKDSDGIAAVFTPSLTLKDTHLAHRSNSLDSDVSSLANDQVEKISDVVDGADISDLPTRYTVQDLAVDEVPVIGRFFTLYVLLH